MERGKAILAAGITAASLTVGGLAFAAGSGLLASNPDTVGNLRPVATQLPADAPQEITIYVDPVTGTATTVAPPATVPASGDPSATTQLATADTMNQPAVAASDDSRSDDRDDDREREDHEEREEDD
jgi:hypothetical protein